MDSRHGELACEQWAIRSARFYVFMFVGKHKKLNGRQHIFDEQLSQSDAAYGMPSPGSDQQWIIISHMSECVRNGNKGLKRPRGFISHPLLLMLWFYYIVLDL